MSYIEGFVCAQVKRPKHIKAQFKRKELHSVYGHVCVHVCAGLIVPHNARLTCRRDRERGRGRETRWTTSQLPQGAGYAPIQSLSLSLASLAPTSRMLRQQVLTRKQIDRTHRPTEHSRTHSRHNMSFNTLRQQ